MRRFGTLGLGSSSGAGQADGRTSARAFGCVKGTSRNDKALHPKLGGSSRRWWM